MVVFSSEVRSLLASDWIERKHDPVGLADYPRYQTVHAPRTIVKGVSRFRRATMRLQARNRNRSLVGSRSVGDAIGTLTEGGLARDP